jgi:hypothetical protein
VAIKTARPNNPEDPGDDDDDDNSSNSDQEASSSEGDDDDDDDQEDTSPNDDGSDDNDPEDPNALEEPTPSNNVDMYEALAAHHEREELAIEAELREPDSDDGPLCEGDITQEANKGVTEPTPGVPEAAAIPKLLADVVWPKHRVQSGGKRQFRSLPLQRDRPPARDADPDFTALPSTSKSFLGGRDQLRICAAKCQNPIHSIQLARYWDPIQ